MRIFVFVAAMVVGACVPEDGPWMDPGENCMNCHRANGIAPEWTVAGTAFTDSTGKTGAVGATVTVTDSAGKSLSILTNGAGNFYSAEPLTPPYTLAIEWNGKRNTMPDPAPKGACNSCHRATGDDAVGVLYAP